MLIFQLLHPASVIQFRFPSKQSVLFVHQSEPGMEEEKGEENGVDEDEEDESEEKQKLYFATRSKQLFGSF